MFVIDALMTVAPLLGYYSQYSLMLDSRSVGTFSIDICAVLIIANILRIFFWFAHGFAANLLLQSLLVIGIQFLILDLCIRLGYKQKHELDKQSFWRWDSLKPFVLFALGLFSAVALLTLLLSFFPGAFAIYGNLLGGLSLSIEATLAFPQLVSNQRNRSVEGLSIFMIVAWFCGDYFKTLYFVTQSQPMQFILSGSVQLTVDTLILIQIMAFKENVNYNNLKEEQPETELSGSSTPYKHTGIDNSGPMHTNPSSMHTDFPKNEDSFNTNHSTLAAADLSDDSNICEGI